MHIRERAVIYGILTLLVALNVVTMIGRAPAGAAHAAATPTAGPEAVDTIDLRGDPPASNLVLRNTKGRLAWSDSPYDRVYSTAFVHIGKIMGQLMQSEALEEDRDRMLADLEDRESEYREQLEGIGDRLQEMDPDSDDARRQYEEGSELYKQYMEWQQEALTTRGRLDAKHLERAYREMTAAVEVVAARKQIDLVYRFIPTDRPFDAEDPESAMNAIRLRTALLYPADLDITDDVLEELSLETD